MFYTDDLSSPRTKVCSSCGRPMSRSVKGDICQACSDEELYAEVKDFILHNNVTEMEVPWTAACQASLSITNSWSLLKLMSIQSVMPSNHLILCHPLILLPSVFPSLRVFSNDFALRVQLAKY